MTWQRAVTLVWLGKVEVVEEYQDRLVRSVTLEIRVPSIIRSSAASGHRKQVVRFSRETSTRGTRGAASTAAAR